MVATLAAGGPSAVYADRSPTQSGPTGVDCVLDSAAAMAVTSNPASSLVSVESEPLREGADSNGDAVVSRQEAEQAALDAVGSGRVTWSAPEDDRGAVWEIEGTRDDGYEIDVYVAAVGTVIKQVCKLGAVPALGGAGELPSGGVVSQQEAEQAALDALGEGTVTWVEREDERGAAWEIEVILPDGREIDVLIGPDGRLIA
jgi:hypothetical protein